jgi:hypothetical protein
MAMSYWFYFSYCDNAIQYHAKRGNVLKEAVNGDWSNYDDAIEMKSK